MAKFCKHCGSPIKEGAKFCTGCGTRIDPPVPQAPQCAYCGAALKVTSKFCPICGKSVGGAAPVENAYAPANYQAVQYQYPQQPIKKRKKPYAIGASVISILLAVSILFTGLVTPGWMKAGKIKSIYKDNSYVSMKLPKEDEQTKRMLAVSAMSVRAQLNAMLTEEKFYRAVEQGKPIAEIEALLHQNKAAWEAVDVLSTATYVMSYSLYQSEKSSADRKKLAIGRLENPFVITAHAANDLNMGRFDDAKQWAEYIQEIYDHAKTNQVAYIAKLLKTDAKRAKIAIEMSQSILKGEAEGKADIDSGALMALQKTKCTGKVAGFIAAAVMTGGTSMTIMSATGFVASGIDTAIEVADTGLKIHYGEDHQLTKKFEEDVAKIAPIISIASLANLGSWEKSADIVGNLRYIADCGVETYSDSKILGISFSSGNGNEEVKLLCKDTKNLSDTDIENLSKALNDMGFAKEVAEEIANKVRSASDEMENTDAEPPISALPDEVLDEKIEETSMEEVDWDALFEEIFNEFKEEMEKKGKLPEDDFLWDYDPFIPPEDLPQPGDEDGDWDDPSKWSKPDMPYEDEPSSNGNTDEDDPLLKYNGKYVGTATITEYYQGDDVSIKQEGINSAMVTITNDDIVKPWNFGHGQNFDKDSIQWSTNAASGSATADDGRYKVSWHFEETRETIKLFIDVYEERPANVINMNSKYTYEAHYVLMPEGSEDLSRFTGKYMGSCKEIMYDQSGEVLFDWAKEVDDVEIRKESDGSLKPYHLQEISDRYDDIIQWDVSILSGETSRDYETYNYSISWHLEEANETTQLYIDVYKTDSALGSAVVLEHHYVLTKYKEL